MFKGRYEPPVTEESQALERGRERQLRLWAASDCKLGSKYGSHGRFSRGNERRA